ncbi:hypothetical protein AC579_3851 [Pseudocercospora musae]|uniref:Uncharacterized protein n=1 Tax=Pseudocercospora musae TaxID=113226 RepID=A0A139IS20_9PEZI|nr:hypothetical protein AC579_3851 [Pseudocercospora musae]
MAGTPPEQPWSNHEKNYLLAEIIKNANLHPHVLFDVLRSYNIQPRWEEIPLPPGRSLNSSRYAFEALRASLQMGTPIAAHTPTPLSTAPPTLKRGLPYEGASYSAGAPGPAGGRAIMPKLQPSPAPTIYAHQSQSSEPPIKRKRGRPTKAEALKKAETAGATSQTPGAPGPTSGPRMVAQASSQPTESSPGPATTATEEHASLQVQVIPIRVHRPADEGVHVLPGPSRSHLAAISRHREDPLGLPRSTPASAPPADPTEQPRAAQ